jgi:hypothetical protein
MRRITNPLKILAVLAVPLFLLMAAGCFVQRGHGPDYGHGQMYNDHGGYGHPYQGH